MGANAGQLSSRPLCTTCQELCADAMLCVVVDVKGGDVIGRGGARVFKGVQKTPVREVKDTVDTVLPIRARIPGNVFHIGFGCCMIVRIEGCLHSISQTLNSILGYP